MAIPCNRCGSPLSPWGSTEDSEFVCPSCAAKSLVRVYPALWRTGEETPARAAAEGESTCYDHPSKQAVASCSQCGRFVCQLCAVEFRGAVWCPQCFAAGASSKGAPELEQGRVLYDSMALMLAAGVPIILWFLLWLTAPAAIYVAIRYWNKPLSVTRRTRWRALAAIGIGACQIGAMIWLVAYVISKASSQA